MANNSKNKKIKFIKTFLILFIIILVSSLLFKLVSKKSDNSIQLEAQSPDLSLEKIEKSQVKDKTKTDLSKLIGYKKTVDTINLRKVAREDGEVLTSVPKAAYVEFFGNLGKWDKVIYNGVEGYCANEYLELYEEEDIFKIIDGILIVNKDYALPKDFNPGLNKNLEDAFKKMQKEAKEHDIVLKIASGFRDYSFQEEIFNNCVERDGLEKALTYTARPGYSEHQTGLSIDIMGRDKEARINAKFDNTKEALWLEENAYKFGFILRYPKGKEDITGTKHESWHYRYVGEDRARSIYESGLTLEEYLNLK